MVYLGDMMRPIYSTLLFIAATSTLAQSIHAPATGDRDYFAAGLETRMFAAGPSRRFVDAPGSRLAIGSLSASFTYAASGEIAGSNRSLMGWTLAPELNFTPHLALQADFTNLYVRSIDPAQSRLSLAAGPRYNLAPRSRLTPFLYAEGGEVRRSISGSVVKDWNPVVKAGLGLDLRIVRGFGVEVVPGEYTGQLNDDSTWLHTYSVRGGVVFNFYH